MNKFLYIAIATLFLTGCGVNDSNQDGPKVICFKEKTGYTYDPINTIAKENYQIKCSDSWPDTLWVEKN